MHCAKLTFNRLEKWWCHKKRLINAIVRMDRKFRENMIKIARLPKIVGLVQIGGEI